MRKTLLLMAVLFLGLWCSANASEPYYLYIHAKNPRLKPAEIAEIVAANHKFSAKYKSNMFRHVCKTGRESGFKPDTGDKFTIAGRTYNNQPCYGIECLQVDVVAGMYPKITKIQIKRRLLHDYTFAIECAYRLDSANRINATKLGYTSEYSNRVVTQIMYNCGKGSWKKYHNGLSKYLKSGKKLEDLTVGEWSHLRLNFHEVFSLNYYADILTQARILTYYINTNPPTTPRAK